MKKVVLISLVCMAVAAFVYVAFTAQATGQ